MRDFRAWSFSMNPNGAALESVNMRTLEHRRLEQALVMFFKSLKLNSPSYISDFFTPQTTPYNLRNSKFKVNQLSHRTKYLHNSFSCIVSHLWNNLPMNIKEENSIVLLKRKLHDITLSKAVCLCGSCS